jgi:hypothetical protein
MQVFNLLFGDVCHTLVGSEGNAPFVVFPRLFFDDRVTAGCREHRP